MCWQYHFLLFQKLFWSRPHNSLKLLKLFLLNDTYSIFFCRRKNLYLLQADLSHSLDQKTTIRVEFESLILSLVFSSLMSTLCFKCLWSASSSVIIGIFYIFILISSQWSHLSVFGLWKLMLKLLSKIYSW